MSDALQADVAAIGNIAAIPTILNVVCSTTGMGFAAVARVTEERWIACSVLDKIRFGLKAGSELKVETTICHEIRQMREPVVIDHVSEDKLFCKHRTPAMYGFQSYISIPIILPDGEFFGTLCAIDPRPARLKNPETIGMFKLFAELIAFHLDAQRKLASTESKLKAEQKTAELRDQFIAVLGHDLRNPLGAISSGAMLLERMPLSERAASVAALIRDSASRMLGLIENVLDFARGRLGGGITLNRDAEESLDPVLKQVIAELRSSNPEREIQVELNLTETVYCDRGRIAQLFSNLLGNALMHGTDALPVKVHAYSNKEKFELRVTNSAPQIPPAGMEMLFNPFCRGTVKRNGQGLGLGLYIASEIARAHGGKIDVTSTPEETCFIFTMPAKLSEATLPAAKIHEAA